MKLKEFLSVRAIEFQSINVLEDAAGLTELGRLGARSVPVLSRGDEWIFAQNLGHVVRFVGLNEATGPELSPEHLVARLDRFLGTAIQIIPQMPDSLQLTDVPNRPRSYRVLSHHIFRIAESFLEVAAGAELTHEMNALPPPGLLRGFADIAVYGETVRARLSAWWAAQRDRSGQQMVATYYGPQSMHELLERSTWHSGQHVRQWLMLLELAGVTPGVRLTAADYAGLPMPANAWDG